MGKFQYQSRDKSKIDERANQTGSNRENFIVPGFKLFKIQKDNKVRILPPTWNDPSHYGFDVWVHYNVGNGSSYACPKLMGKSKFCPICDEVENLKREGKTKEAGELSAKKRVLVWVIDRNNESDGPKFWPMPWTLDREIVKQAVDDELKGYLLVDKPDDGYDIIFSKEGEKDRTEYVGVKVARKSSPISFKESEVEEWLDFIVDHPVPSIIKYVDVKELSDIFNGITPAEEEDDFEKNFGKAPKTEESDEEVELTKEMILSMDRDELEDVAASDVIGLTNKTIRSLNDDELRDKVLEKAGFLDEDEEKEESTKPSAASKLSDKLKSKGLK